MSASTSTSEGRQYYTGVNSAQIPKTHTIIQPGHLVIVKFTCHILGT